MPGSETSLTAERLRELPSVDVLLRACAGEVAQWGHPLVVGHLREMLAALRAEIESGEAVDSDEASLRLHLRERLALQNAAVLKPVFNLTGTVLHTNLGRASLPEAALDAVREVSIQPSNLEFDLETGRRGDRETHVEQLVCELTGAEAATAVNNNAAAVLLVLNTLAMGREVPVSRGELVEIGGSFRIPEVMQRSGCTLVEIGATNRTHLKDYRNAVNDNTALLMKVHTSNYSVEGFTAAVSERELAQLGKELNLPVMADLGSGNLVDFAALGLPPEPTVTKALDSGLDLVTFSGDKLLGGPQCGIVCGRADLVDKVRRNPLKRALRLDKMTLAALAEVLKLYRNPDKLLRELPTLRQLTRPEQEVQVAAQRLVQPVADVLQAFDVSVRDCFSQIGSGALPVESIPSAALRIAPVAGGDAALRSLSESLRQLPRPVIGRLHDGALWLDLRCLEDERAFLDQLHQLRT